MTRNQGLRYQRLEALATAAHAYIRAVDTYHERERNSNFDIISMWQEELRKAVDALGEK